MFLEVHSPSSELTDSFTHSVTVAGDNALEVLTVTSTVSGSGSRCQHKLSFLIRSVCISTM
jgi:hypothetical protein